MNNLNNAILSQNRDAMSFKQANTIIINAFGIYSSPVQLCQFIQDYKGNDKNIIQALNVMYDHLS